MTTAISRPQHLPLRRATSRGQPEGSERLWLEGVSAADTISAGLRLDDGPQRSRPGRDAIGPTLFRAEGWPFSSIRDWPGV
jgi:hypothetical protein